jgi:hypothetical protein
MGDPDQIPTKLQPCSSYFFRTESAWSGARTKIFVSTVCGWRRGVSQAAKSSTLTMTATESNVFTLSVQTPLLTPGFALCGHRSLMSKDEAEKIFGLTPENYIK